MKKIIMVLGIILSVTWMIVIFTYSNKSGEQVDEKANTIIQTITVSDETYQQKTEEEKILVNNDYEFYISKTVHVLEYGALCFFLLMAFVLVKKRSLNYLFSFIITVLFAISDEWHQTFIPDRTSRPQDVLIDASAAIICILSIELIYTIFKIFKPDYKNTIA
jgi:VanZ family protein